jgi:hypothetical protein
LCFYFLLELAGRLSVWEALEKYFKDYGLEDKLESAMQTIGDSIDALKEALDEIDQCYYNTGVAQLGLSE